MIVCWNTAYVSFENTFNMLGVNDPFDIFHLNILGERLCFSVKSLSSQPVTTTPPWNCSLWVHFQTLLLQLCTFLTASVRKETGNSSHPPSSCSIPPILHQWRRLALVTGGQELSHSEGQEDRSVFIPVVGLETLLRLFAFFLSILFLFLFLFFFFFLNNAEPKHPVFKTFDCLPLRNSCSCISLKCKTILLIQEAMKLKQNN